MKKEKTENTMSICFGTIGIDITADNLILPNDVAYWRVDQSLDGFITCLLVRRVGGRLISEMYYVEQVEDSNPPMFRLALQSDWSSTPEGVHLSPVFNGPPPFIRSVLVWRDDAWCIAKLVRRISACTSPILLLVEDKEYEITNDILKALRWCELPPNQPEPTN